MEGSEMDIDGPRELQQQLNAGRNEEAHAAQGQASDEIRKLGIEPTDDDLNPDVGDGPRPSKRARIDNRDIQKIYDNRNTAGSGSGALGSASGGWKAPTQAELSDADFLEMLTSSYKNRDQGDVPGPSTSANTPAPKPDISPQLLDIHLNYVRSQQQLMIDLQKEIAGILPDPDQSLPKPRIDLIASLSTSADLMTDVCKFLRPKDIVNLYSISKNFHYMLDTFMRSCMKALSGYLAPTASQFLTPRVYRSLCIRDPMNRPRDPAYHDLGYLSRGTKKQKVTNLEVRMVPSLKWLGMVAARERYVRDIIASMARMGHRLAKNSNETLIKLWLLMDVATSEDRLRVVRNVSMFRDQDLYNAQLFFVKLILLTNDPFYGPRSTRMMQVLMGQRSLVVLWGVLRHKIWQNEHEPMHASLRYQSHMIDAGRRKQTPVFGIPAAELGTGHLEGWGEGEAHLQRPDEVVPIEAVRRNLSIEDHIPFFFYFGHVDLVTGRNLVPSLDELYMSDDDLPRPTLDFDRSVDGGGGNVPFLPGMWTPRQARKARWGTLTHAERAEIIRLDTQDLEQELVYDFTPSSDEDDDQVESDPNMDRYNAKLAIYNQEMENMAREKAKAKALKKRKGKGKAEADEVHESDDDNEVNVDHAVDAFFREAGKPVENNPFRAKPERMSSTLGRLSRLKLPGPEDNPLLAAARAIDSAHPSAVQARADYQRLEDTADQIRLDDFVERFHAGEFDNADDEASDEESEDDDEEDQMSSSAVDTQNDEEEELDEEELAELDAQADEDYDEDELDFPWEQVMRNAHQFNEAFAAREEQDAMDWQEDVDDAEAENNHTIKEEEVPVYVEDPEERDPRLANASQVELQKRGEKPGEEQLSDVEFDENGLMLHGDADPAPDVVVPNSLEDLNMDPEIPGKNGLIRGYYRRY